MKVQESNGSGSGWQKEQELSSRAVGKPPQKAGGSEVELEVSQSQREMRNPRCLPCQRVHRRSLRTPWQLQGLRHQQALWQQVGLCQMVFNDDEEVQSCSCVE